MPKSVIFEYDNGLVVGIRIKDGKYYVFRKDSYGEFEKEISVEELQEMLNPPKTDIEELLEFGNVYIEDILNA